MRQANRIFPKIALPCGVALLTLSVAMANGPSSTNFAIPWETIDGGGDLSTSASYILTDSIGQSMTIGVGASASFVVNAGFQTPPDEDEDTFRGFVDNCSLESNADQRDTNADGFGNRCDADLNDDCVVNVLDLADLKTDFFTAEADPDFDGDGAVNVIDLGIMKVAFFEPPGPSGLPNACSGP